MFKFNVIFFNVVCLICLFLKQCLHYVIVFEFACSKTMFELIRVMFGLYIFSLSFSIFILYTFISLSFLFVNDKGGERSQNYMIAFTNHM